MKEKYLTMAEAIHLQEYIYNILQRVWGKYRRQAAHELQIPLEVLFAMEVVYTWFAKHETIKRKTYLD